MSITAALDTDVHTAGDATSFGLALEDFHDLREHRPCYLQEFTDPALIDKAWVVSRHEDIWNIDRDRDIWAVDGGFAGTWRVPAGRGRTARTARDCRRAFLPARLDTLEESLREHARQIIDAAFAAGGRIDFIHAVAQPLPLRALEDVLETAPDRYAENGLGRAELAAVAESASGALAHGLHQLLLEPEKMDWLRQHADDVPPTVVHELLRIASPSTHLIRTATRDTRLHGHDICEGERVALAFAAANFDPEAFVDPCTFDPARDPNPHLGFAGGPHTGAGRKVLTLVIEVLLEELLQRTSHIRPAGDIRYVGGAFERGVDALPVELVVA